MTRKVLITGGAGFIGSNFIRRFLKTHPEWAVVNFDKLTYAGNPANLREIEKNPAYSFIRGDLTKPSAVTKACEGVGAVIHFAAETHVDRSIDDDRNFLNTNIFGTRNLLEAARRRKISRFIHISTDEVYGSVEKGEASEQSSLEPNSPYAASKAAADLLIRAYQKTYGFQVMIVRSANNFGPYQYPEKVIPLFITNLLEKKKVPLYSRGENRRDWLYVEDNCEAIELIFERGVAGEIYNVGGGNEMSNRELTQKILDLFGCGEEWIEYVADRPGHDLRYAIDSSKVRGLGFRPRHSFDEALEKTVAWYRNHPDWWQRSSPRRGQALRRDKFTLK